MKRSKRGWPVTAIAAAAVGGTLMLWAPAAWAAPSGAKAAAGLMQLVAVVLLLAAIGLGIGSFGLTVNHTFRRRAALTFGVLRVRPKLSLGAGVVVTLLGLGLLAILRGAPPVQLVVIIAYLGALMPFALGAAARLAGEQIEPPLDGDAALPGARAHLRGGLVLSGVNAVPVLGSVLFFGLLLASVGAALLAYFSRFIAAPGAAAPVFTGAPLRDAAGQERTLSTRSSPARATANR